MGVQINLKNNEISGLPTDETLHFLRAGGSFKNETNGICFDYNPLKYPPQHTYTGGKDAVITYLISNDMP